MASLIQSGLPAKPIIDMLVVMRETETIDRFSGALEGLGIGFVVV